MDFLSLVRPMALFLCVLLGCESTMCHDARTLTGSESCTEESKMPRAWRWMHSIIDEAVHVHGGMIHP